MAALAMASTYPVSGEFTSANYLKAAEGGFDYLEKDNLKLVNDGKENIVDDYCALAAATELYRATKKDKYKAAADARAKSLMSRQISAGGYNHYWRADDGTRRFFHASDGGLPLVTLLYYAEIAAPATRTQVLDVVRKSLEFELAITAEVNNPFGYSREYVQDKTGHGIQISSSLTIVMPLRGGRERTRAWPQSRQRRTSPSASSPMTASFAANSKALLRIS